MTEAELAELLKDETPELQAAAVQDAIRQLYKNDLYRTCKHLLGYTDMTIRTHKKMVKALEEPTPRKLIVMPRGTFKSSIGVVGYSIWRLLRNPNERILIDSEVYGNSKNFLREIKAHLESPAMVELYGPFKTDHNWNEGEITIQQRTEIKKEASITCGGIETVKVGMHYTTIIGDDLNSGNNSATTDGREKVINHYRLNQAILEPNGTYVIIGTRYAVNDVIGFIMENEIKPGLLPKS